MFIDERYPNMGIGIQEELTLKKAIFPHLDEMRTINTTVNMASVLNEGTFLKQTVSTV